MNDVEKALVDIANIREQLAAGTVFQGLGPAVIALTGALALLTALVQSLWPHVLAPDQMTMLFGWVVTAIVGAVLIGAEMVARSRRHHRGMANAMLANAVELFLPALFAGVAVGAVLATFSPDNLWLLPGLWQVFVALGVFVAAKFLPRSMSYVGAWYFLAGITVLIMSSGDELLDPWMMGIPFAVGQFFIAFLLHIASEPENAE